MPRYCCVFGCTCKSDINVDISFHEFPADLAQATAWKKRIRREDFHPSKTTYVCSRHFDENDFLPANENTPSIFRKKRLRKNAIPSLYLRGEEEGSRKVRNTKNSTRAEEPLRKSPRKKLFLSTEGTSSTREEAHVESLTHNLTADDELEKLREELTVLRKENSLLKKNLFRFENLSDTEVIQYTTLTKGSFLCLHSFIERFQPLEYWTGCQVVSISSKDQLLIFLTKAKLDFPFFVLAREYSTTRTTITNVFFTYMYALNEILFRGLMDTVPSTNKNQASQPDTFGNFLNCRVIIDCTEFRITTPRQDLNAAVASYSNYKHNLTGKFLVGVAPNGTITYVSDGFPGNTSDKVITERSGILSHLIVSFWFFLILYNARSYLRVF